MIGACQLWHASSSSYGIGFKAAKCVSTCLSPPSGVKPHKLARIELCFHFAMTNLKSVPVHLDKSKRLLGLFYR
jgi:hypothetical protein